MYLAFYKGPAKGFGPNAFHKAVCWRTCSKYSHVELVFSITPEGIGNCWSSSSRDGGIREKVIDFSSGHWDVYDVSKIFDNHEAVYAREWFRQHAEAKYDYFGLLAFVVFMNTGDAQLWFCSEAVAEALQLRKSWTYSPQKLFEFIRTEAVIWIPTTTTQSNLQWSA